VEAWQAHTIDPGELFDGPIETLGERLVEGFVGWLQQENNFLILLRSLGNPMTTPMLRELAANSFGKVLKYKLKLSQPELRAVLIQAEFTKLALLFEAYEGYADDLIDTGAFTRHSAGVIQSVVDAVAF
jgi:hypothetical protein